MNKTQLIKLVQNFEHYQGIIGKDKYFNSSVLIPLIFLGDEYHFLFEKRANNIRQGGEVSFPGGEFDTSKDKDYLDTAVRETIEEIGIAKEKIQIIGSMGTLVAPMGVTVDSFVGVLNMNELNELKIDKKEVERIFTIPVSYFAECKPSEYFVRLEVHTQKRSENGGTIDMLPVKKLKLPNRYAKPWKGREHKILVYETKEETVWGITAELVYEFCKLINQ
jgi:8-oxo-dGTP pyrophosphatase MutT (NUDIX family)